MARLPLYLYFLSHIVRMEWYFFLERFGDKGAMSGSNLNKCPIKINIERFEEQLAAFELYFTSELYKQH